MLFDFAQQLVQGVDLARRQTAEGLDNPAFVPACHFVKNLAPAGGQAHAVGAAVARNVHPFDQAFGHELVGDAGDVAAGNHHATRQLVHLQPVRIALELGHQVKTRQGGVELFAQLPAHLFFNQLRAGQQAQPQAQRLGVFAVSACFHVHGLLLP